MLVKPTTPINIAMIKEKAGEDVSIEFDVAYEHWILEPLLKYT